MPFKFDDLNKFKDKVEKIQVEKFLKTTCDELSLRLLRKVQKRTPVGVYPSSSGKQGGTLRKNWKAVKAERVNGKVTSFVVNDTPYAMYVEYGHRTRNHKSWVEGQFFLTNSTNELRKDAQKIVDNKFNKFIKDTLND